MSALLTMEEGAICEGKLEYLRIFYELGVRMFTFTWNFPNELAYPNRYEYLGPGQDSFVPETEKGLTEKGFEFLEEMERLGIIADVSHLGDKGILDVISHAKRPFVASHSGARAVCRHCRNLTDEMIRGIGGKGRLSHGRQRFYRISSGIRKNSGIPWKHPWTIWWPISAASSVWADRFRGPGIGF